MNDPKAVALGNAAISEAEVLRQINNVKSFLTTHKEQVPNHIYNAMDGISRTLLGFLDKKSHTGWARGVVDAAGEAIWTPEQAMVLEEAAPAMIQAGGGGLNPMKFTASSSFVQPSAEMPPISIDETYEKIKQYLAMIDQKNREIAATVGPVAFINQMTTDPAIGPILPYLPFRLQMPARLILPVANAVLEACRLIVSNNFYDVAILRKISSLVLAILDVLRGEWKDGLLSLAGMVSQDWMLFGMVGKIGRWVYNFVSPDIQARLEDDLFASSKSMVIGGWLWLLSVASPDFVRGAVNQMIDKAKASVEKLHEKLEALEEKAQGAAKQAGVKVTFPRIPLDKIPTFDDIQNFQSLLSNPEIYCSAEFQMVLAPAMAIPPLRLVFELMNIPTLPEKITEKCKDQPASIGDTLAAAMQPVVVPLADPNPEEPKEEKSKEISETSENTLLDPVAPKTGGSRRYSTRKNRRASYGGKK